MNLTFIPTAHPLYPEELELRFRVLREPLGFRREDVRFAFDDESLHLIAEESGQVLGCVLFHPEGPKTGRLFQMAVAAGRQRTGIGCNLVRKLEQEVLARGFDEITLHARAKVLGFYEKLGYQVFGAPFTEVGIAHRYMRRALTLSPQAL